MAWLRRFLHGQPRTETSTKSTAGDQAASPLADAWRTRASREPGRASSSRLNALAEPWDSVFPDDHWMTEGFDRVEEAQLHRAPRLLPPQHCDALGDWWLAVQSDGSRTPHWDIVSTCTVDGRKWVLLEEAKAHSQELKTKDQVVGSRPNCERIAERIEEANGRLADWTELRWALSHEHRYQMANRFAWSWKLTELGDPVILVYLGFLGAEEMREGKEQNPLNSHTEGKVS